MVKDKQISCKCIFCGSTNFELNEENYVPEEGEEIKCSDCGEFNDYSILKQNVIEEGKKQIEQEFKSELNKKFKNLKFK